jgi:hypothetical protein
MTAIGSSTQPTAAPRAPQWIRGLPVRGLTDHSGDAMTTTTTMATMMTTRAMATPTMKTMWIVTWFVVMSWSYRW